MANVRLMNIKSELSILQHSDNSEKSCKSTCDTLCLDKGHIFIMTLQNTILSIDIDPDCRIEDLTKAIYDRTGISACLLRLKHGCREYVSDSSLNMFCGHNSSITLLFRLMGGNPEVNPRIMPMMWWFGFGCSYQDGRVCDEGRICHVLSEFKFKDDTPRNWYSSCPLSTWKGVSLIESGGMCVFELIIWLDVVQGIKELNLISCGLQRLPESIGNLTSLIGLYLHINQLSYLPDSIGNLTSLTGLFVFNIQLSHLPESIGKCVSLTKLIVSYNQLTSLPESIGSLTLLSYLNASGNQLSSLPESIRNLESLTYLKVDNNPLTSTQEGRNEIERRFGRAGLSLNVGSCDI